MFDDDLEEMDAHEMASDTSSAEPEPSPSLPQGHAKPLGPKRVLTLMSGGTSCTDYAGFGNHDGASGETEEEFILFTGEILASQPDLVMQEITVLGTASKFTTFLQQNKYKSITGVLHPNRFGKPSKRPRRYVFAWLDSIIHFWGSWDEFERLRRRELVLAGGDMFVETPTERRRYMNELAQLQKQLLWCP